MTKDQLNMAFAMAKDEAFVSDYKTLAWSLGFGLSDYQPTTISVEALATLIRYQCSCLNGSWDMIALDEIARVGKDKFLVLI
jgi:hypothetical protein